MKCFFNRQSDNTFHKQSITVKVIALFCLLVNILLVLWMTHGPAMAKEVMPGLRIEENRYQSHRYVTVSLTLDQLVLTQHWLNPETQESYRSMNSFNSHVRQRQDSLLFAINSGIYTKEYTPLGLYIEDSKVLTPLNLVKSNEGRGNFSLLPNGVFYLTDQNRAYIADTDTFHQQYQGQYVGIKDAVQSGPMLLINGEYNPYFIPKSNSLRIRSGVCAMDDGRSVTFVVTEDSVNFYEFASYFKEKLACQNALYLDGTLARMYVDGRIYGASFWQAKPLVGIWSVIQKAQ